VFEIGFRFLDFCCCYRRRRRNRRPFFEPPVCHHDSVIQNDKERSPLSSKVEPVMVVVVHTGISHLTQPPPPISIVSSPSLQNLNVKPNPLPPRRHLRHDPPNESPLTRHSLVNTLQLLAHRSRVKHVFLLQLGILFRGRRAGGKPEVLGLAVVGSTLVDVEGGFAVVFGEGCYGLVFEGDGLLGGGEG
jgi:hypothetical protein